MYITLCALHIGRGGRPSSARSELEEIGYCVWNSGMSGKGVDTVFGRRGSFKLQRTSVVVRGAGCVASMGYAVTACGKTS
jgi:hypothetical protein